MATRKNVKDGANLLDDHFPGWAGKINQDRIKMVSNKLCILGQLATHKKTTAEKLSVQYGCAGDSVARFGFEGEGSDHDEQIANWWREEIKKRLGVEPVNEFDGIVTKKKKKQPDGKKLVASITKKNTHK